MTRIRPDRSAASLTRFIRRFDGSAEVRTPHHGSYAVRLDDLSEAALEEIAAGLVESFRVEWRLRTVQRRQAAFQVSCLSEALSHIDRARKAA